MAIHLRASGVTCHIGSHSWHKRTHPALTPGSEGWYLIYLPRRDRSLSLPMWLVTHRDGLPAYLLQLKVLFNWFLVVDMCVLMLGGAGVHVWDAWLVWRLSGSVRWTGCSLHTVCAQSRRWRCVHSHNYNSNEADVLEMSFFTLAINFETLLTTRRYASTGNSDRNVSVRPSVHLSVCHALVLCQNEES